jgi:hypothetical protein
MRELSLQTTGIGQASTGAANGRSTFDRRDDFLCASSFPIANPRFSAAC